MDTARRLTILRDQKGLALVYIALIMLLLVGFLGLAIDLGHLYIVRGELQNAADASALAGANALYPPVPPLTLNFSNAQAAATAFIGNNSSDGSVLSSGTVETGYWDAASKSIIASPANPYPAVGVTISKSAGNNGGAVPVFFAKLLPGVSSTSAVTSNKAVAIRGFAGSAPGGTAFPIALDQCVTNAYFSQVPAPSPVPTVTIGVNIPITINGTTCPNVGQWTSFFVSPPNTPTIGGYITQPSTSPELKTNDEIQLFNGNATALFNNYLNIPASGEDVVMPITDDVLGQTSFIKGFAWFHIDRVVIITGTRYVQGHFTDITYAPVGSLPGGSVSDAVAPPQMVQ